MALGQSGDESGAFQMETEERTVRAEGRVCVCVWGWQWARALRLESVMQAWASMVQMEFGRQAAGSRELTKGFRLWHNIIGFSF